MRAVLPDQGQHQHLQRRAHLPHALVGELRPNCDRRGKGRALVLRRSRGDCRRLATSAVAVARAGLPKRWSFRDRPRSDGPLRLFRSRSAKHMPIDCCTVLAVRALHQAADLQQPILWKEAVVQSVRRDPPSPTASLRRGGGPAHRPALCRREAGARLTAGAPARASPGRGGPSLPRLRSLAPGAGPAHLRKVAPRRRDPLCPDAHGAHERPSRRRHARVRQQYGRAREARHRLGTEELSLPRLRGRRQGCRHCLYPDAKLNDVDPEAWLADTIAHLAPRYQDCTHCVTSTGTTMAAGKTTAFASGTVGLINSGASRWERGTSSLTEPTWYWNDRQTPAS